jgi:hypothetical protein
VELFRKYQIICVSAIPITEHRNSHVTYVFELPPPRFRRCQRTKRRLKKKSGTTFGKMAVHILSGTLASLNALENDFSKIITYVRSAILGFTELLNHAMSRTELNAISLIVWERRAIQGEGATIQSRYTHTGRHPIPENRNLFLKSRSIYDETV